MEARQTLDQQPRPGIPPKKSQRDRLIHLAQEHPNWALGYQDETWWSRLAQPALHAWSEPKEPLGLVEQTVASTDPDPKALACYGLLVRQGTEPEEVWLRFVTGRPVSAITTQFLDWCCVKLKERQVPVLLLIWDNAGLSSQSGSTDLDRRAQSAGQAGTARRADPAVLPAHQESLVEPDGTQVGAWQTGDH